MNTLSKMVQSETELSKSNVLKYSEELVNLTEEGHLDTLTALARIEFLSQVLETAKASLREKAVDELDLYGPESKTGVVKSGVTFKHKETAVKYDFSNTEHWRSIKANEDQISESRKEFEKFLKTLKQKSTILDEETGEMNQVFPPIKSSKTTVEITLQK
jgi:hypothetical protein